MDQLGEAPAGMLARPRLQRRLNEARHHRLTTIVADAGFGKSVLLAQWLASADLQGVVVVRPVGKDLHSFAGALVAAVERHAPEEGARLQLLVGSGRSDVDDRPGALAALVCASLANLTDLEVVLVLEDAHGLQSAALRFLERLCRQAPATVHLLVASRTALPFPTQRMTDEVLSLTGADLRFDRAELSQVLQDVLGDDAETDRVRRLTGGWPAAVRLAAAVLARHPAPERAAQLQRLTSQGGAVVAELARQVLETETDQMRRLSQLMAPYDGFCAELAETLGCHDPATTLADLAARGIVVRLGFDRFQYYAFPRLLRDFLRQQLPLSEGERPVLMRAAATWFEENGQVEGALRCLMDLRDGAGTARVLREHGLALFAANRGARVAAAFEVLSPADLDPALNELTGLVQEARGEVTGALASYRAASRDALTSRLAWRTGTLLYQQGELEEALRILAVPDLPSTADDAILLAWRATVLWARGEVDQARAAGVPALALAERLGDDRALAATHTALGLLAAQSGDREANREHYEIALVHAERAGDLTHVIRIRNNLGSHLLEEGELEAALAQLEVAIDLAEAGGHRFYLSLALANRGEVRLHLGQLDAATVDLETALEIERSAATKHTSSALVHLGHVYRHRGYATLSRRSYEDAIAAGRETGDVNLLVPALSGLAQLLRDSDAELARQLAEEALSFDQGLGRVGALLAAGWVALAAGRDDEAGMLAREALREADLRRDRLGRAEALHLTVQVEADGPAEDPRLTEAAGLVDQTGAQVWRARIGLTQARRLPVLTAQPRIAQIEQLARSLGARALADEAAALSRELDRARGHGHLEIRTLGGFRLRRDGQLVGPSGWPDESARALLKRLAVRSRAPWSMSDLARSLAPGAAVEDVKKAVTEARLVLDLQQRFGEQHFVRVIGDLVELQNVDVDVHLFLDESARGLARSDRDLLRSAEARYGGEVLEEHPGEQWVLALREEARGRYVEVSRALATEALHSGDPEAAGRYGRRILERDPYDEQAHVVLVAALHAQGRQPEARRSYTAYVQRLEELGLEAVPWGQVTA